ncbi:DUF4282 domain-containing protein [Nitrincola lacisaponensis]|uniref:DUF4282 domain-containing protein n=1 Tax=Nitrincola lacisaponensis TaxID=267850 RepID=UPI000559DF8F|nr:DUF4282 domain-containing protein [Nitrincola lacisaponensis]
MKNIFFFDAMLTPKIITIVYWLLLAGVVITGLGMIFGSFNAYYGGGMMFLGGLATIIFGSIGVRIWCELLIVLFKINDNIRKVAEKQ